MELSKLLDEDKIIMVTKIINKMWFERTLPESLSEATIASIFKKGETDDPANYRPISLLNSLYKIYASLIQRRIAE